MYLFSLIHFINDLCFHFKNFGWGHVRYFDKGEPEAKAHRVWCPRRASDEGRVLVGEGLAVSRPHSIPTHYRKYPKLEVKTWCRGFSFSKKN